MRFATLSAPVACGSYVVRSQVLTADPANPGGTGDDQNGWKLRVGTDNDADPNNAHAGELRQPRRRRGHERRADDRHGAGVVPAELGSGRLPDVLRVHDARARRRRRSTTSTWTATPASATTPRAIPRTTPPRRRVEPWARCPATASGTTAGRSRPASATRSRRPTTGWWRIVNCLSNGNQLIQEGQPGVLSYYTQPPTPSMTLTKTDAVATAAPGQALTYNITATNNSPAVGGGAANNVVVTDTIPAGLHVHRVLDPDADAGHVDVLAGGRRRDVHPDRMDQPRRCSPCSA